MDHDRVGAWIDSRRAWEQADTPAVLGLFTEDAAYRSRPLRAPRTGHDGIAAYWTKACADQQDVQAHFGDPIVDGDRVAVEWWTTMHAGGDPITLIGCLFLGAAHRRPLSGPPRVLAPHRQAGPPASRLGPPLVASRVGRRRARVPAVRPPSSAGAGPRAMRGPGGRPTPRPRPRCTGALTPSTAPSRSATLHPGREGVLAYTRRAYATEAGQDPKFGIRLRIRPPPPRSNGGPPCSRKAEPATLIGCSVPTFTPEGLVAAARDYWFLEPGTRPPFERLGPPTSPDPGDMGHGDDLLQDDDAVRHGLAEAQAELGRDARGNTRIRLSPGTPRAADSAGQGRGLGPSGRCCRGVRSARGRSTYVGGAGHLGLGRGRSRRCDQTPMVGAARPRAGSAWWPSAT